MQAVAHLPPRRRLRWQRREVLDPQIDADGAMPLEEARTRSLHYVTFNIHAAQSLAATVARAGVDLWAHKNASTRRGSIAEAIAYMVPFATGQAAWAHEQIDNFLYVELWNAFVVAARAYPSRRTEFEAVAGALLQPPAATDFRRSLWPAPSATPASASSVSTLTAALTGTAGVALVSGAVLLWAQGPKKRSAGGKEEGAALLGRSKGQRGYNNNSTAFLLPYLSAPVFGTRARTHH